MYLNNPVHIALETARGPGYAHRSEDTRDSTTRVDKSYYRNGAPYAVLDYKKPGYIDRNEFLAGVPRSVAQYESNISMSRVRRSAWNEGTNMLLKQAVHYSFKFKTPFVALFDWNTLILLTLLKREERMGGDYCYMTVVGRSHLFRKAFLGFLLAADGYKSGGSSTVIQELQPEDGQDFAAILRGKILEKTHNTRGNRVNYSSSFESGSQPGSQNTEVRSHQSRDDDPNSRGRHRGDSRKQYYPPISGRERTGANDRYTRGRSTGPGKERARSKTRDGRGRMDEPRSKSQYSADRVKMARTPATYGGIESISAAGPTYYQHTPASATTYQHASGSDHTYELDNRIVLPVRGRTDKDKKKEHHKGGKAELALAMKWRAKLHLVFKVNMIIVGDPKKRAWHVFDEILTRREV